MATQSTMHNQQQPLKSASNSPDSVQNMSQMEKWATIGQLTSSVAHEMRNLMGMIRTAAFNIERAIHSSDSTINNNLEVINRSVTRAREFIENLLTLTRAPRGTVEMINVQEVVDSLLNLFCKELEWRKITLIRNYKPTPVFQLDRNALQECLLNLILNAIQSMEPEGTIEVTVEPWLLGVRISVSDTGCGISPDELDKIFHPFFTTKKNGQGTGLGLTIARSLAQELGGDIEVNSHPTKGSTFTISLQSLTKGIDSPKTLNKHTNQ